MNFEEYQKSATALAEYPNQGGNLLYPALGLAGESGEVVDKIKKMWRNKLVTSSRDADFTKEDLLGLVKEIGDVMWYVAALCEELGVPMEHVAAVNIEKLNDRKARGVIKSEGDNR